MMHPHLRMISFMVIMGLIVSGFLVGMDVLTRDRIERNRAFRLQSAVLTANGHSFTLGNFADVFEENIDTIETDEITFYVDQASGNISFLVEGGGVWGPISAVMTLEPDFRTIVAVRVLSQEETPGLGGVVAETDYLAKYVGVVLDEEGGINITHSRTGADNEVDAITGGTRTSYEFQDMINATYAIARQAWAALGGNDE